MTKPTVSIVIPSYNRLHSIASTLRMLAHQTFKDWEVVVVDDGSAIDPSSAFPTLAPHCRLIRLDRNQGPSAARNAGVRASRGRFVAFLDSDDEWLPEKLELQLAAVLASADPDSVLCYTQTKVVESESAFSIQPSRGIAAGENPADYLFLEQGFAQTSSFFVSRKLALAIGFDEQLRQYEDYLFFISARLHIVGYIFLQAPLSVWNNDSRSDRLSCGSGKSIANATLLASRAGAGFGRKAYLRFLMTHLGVDLVRRDPKFGLALAAEAIWARAVTPRYVMRQILRAILPDDVYSRLRGDRKVKGQMN
ncbi:glycosyltransferase family 2 protein [Methylocella silvestris]|uniref:glycosyltransferase family 2 protein n=1 Tax=Methylocella silvestris TaxID=199596 RepID=UPI0015E08795|nr:glycosyltransferase family 2 protein [Methylocella silvestris]